MGSGEDGGQRDETVIKATFAPRRAVHCLHEDFVGSAVRQPDEGGGPVRRARRLDELQERRARTSE